MVKLVVVFNNHGIIEELYQVSARTPPASPEAVDYVCVYSRC